MDAADKGNQRLNPTRKESHVANRQSGESWKQQVNEQTRRARGHTVGGHKQSDNAAGMNNWMREQAHRRSGTVSADEVMSNLELEES